MHASKHSTKKEMYTEKPVMESTEIDDSEANTICSKSTTHTPVFSTTVPSSTLGNTSQQLIFTKSEILNFNFNFSTPTMSTPQEVVPTTPTKVQGSDFGTNLFVIGLLVASFIVLIALALYARKIFSER